MAERLGCGNTLSDPLDQSCRLIEVVLSAVDEGAA